MSETTGLNNTGSDLTNTSAQTTGTNLTPSSIPTSGGLTWSQVENYWIQAGGNPTAAAMAAAVADASSGLDPTVTRTNPDGTTSIGLWLIPQNGTPPGTTDPLQNARAAIALSNNGTDWSQWCVTWSDNNCGEQQGTYLGAGANALASLDSNSSSFNVIGSSPAGSGVGASSATSQSGTTTSPTTSGTLTKVALLGGIGILLIVVVMRMRRNRQAAPPVPEEVPEA